MYSSDNELMKGATKQNRDSVDAICVSPVIPTLTLSYSPAPLGDQNLWK